MRPFKRHKYRAKPTSGYASKREAEYASVLAAMKARGEIADWIEQVPIKLSGGIKYVCDFMLLYPDGTWKLVEVKGMSTQVWKNKMRQMAAERPWMYERLEVLR